jgi:hypothetical protein
LKEQNLARPRDRKEDNIKTNMKAIGQDVVDWIELAQDNI